MKLTEAQTLNREELFYDIVQFLVNETYELDVDYIMSEEDEAVTLCMMEYFVDNFKEASLQENIESIMTGVDINEGLYLELIEVIVLDETIGGFVAGAVHGIGNMLIKRKAEKETSKSKNLTKNMYKANADVKAHKASGNSGVLHNIKGAFLAAKAAKTKERESAQNAVARSANSELRNKNKARTGLANKIDNGIQAARNKVKSVAIGTAGKLATVAGRLAG